MKRNQTEYSKSTPACQGDARSACSVDAVSARPADAGSTLRRALVAAAACGAVAGLASLALAYFSTHPPRIPVRRPRDDDFDVEEVTFASRDGLRLAGWFVPAPAARGGVILCHGFPANRGEMLGWARVLHAAGFHLLLFDFRALGHSDGDLCSIGYHEVEDLLGAADYMVARDEMAGLPLGVIGHSMGGAVALMAAAHDTRLAAVATHGAYANLHSAIEQRGRLFLGPLGPALSKPAVWWGRRWFPIDPRDVSPERLIGRIAPRPVFLGHGRRDRIVSPRDAEALYAAAGHPRRLHWLPKSWHIRVHPDERDAYTEAVVAFFQRHLDGTPPGERGEP